ncbi:MAG: hypothetical protein GX573_15610 [Chloroflexi bacterium]|nr:hypothetical protein [Chloroflexota bacterium]
MSLNKCVNCEAIWEGSGAAICPRCLATHWAATTGMIRDKHDPRLLPSASDSFRSVLPSDFPDRASEYYLPAAYSGTALYSQRHGKYCYVVGVQPYQNAGSAVPPGSAMPTYALDAFLVADPFGGNAHIFAEGQEDIAEKIAQGEYTYLDRCEYEGCDNLQMPGERFCAIHTKPPRAIEPEDDESSSESVR